MPGGTDSVDQVRKAQNSTHPQRHTPDVGVRPGRAAASNWEGMTTNGALEVGNDGPKLILSMVTLLRTILAVAGRFLGVA